MLIFYVAVIYTLCFTGCDILVKAEFLNSGGSVKDRAALFLIKNAEEKGVYQAGILHIYVHKHFVKDK